MLPARAADTCHISPAGGQRQASYVNIDYHTESLLLDYLLIEYFSHQDTGWPDGHRSFHFFAPHISFLVMSLPIAQLREYSHEAMIAECVASQRAEAAAEAKG